MSSLLMLSQGATIGLAVGIPVGVLVLVIIIYACWYISTYNGLQKLKNNVDEGWATIEVQLKKRYDLIPNLVETVRGYAKHESQTLEAVIAARAKAISAKGDEKIKAEGDLSGTLKSLFKLSENYPDLKANANFMDLQRQLREIENEIASARRYYNATVKELNTKIDMFFAGIVARKMRLEKRSYFEIEDAEEREPVKVQF